MSQVDDLFKDKRALKDIIVHELWLETRIPKIIIDEIVSYQFKFVKHKAMKEFKNTWLQYFGMFGIKPGRIEHLKYNFKDGIYTEAELLQARRTRCKSLRGKEHQDKDNC